MQKFKLVFLDSYLFENQDLLFFLAFLTFSACQVSDALNISDEFSFENPPQLERHRV